MIFPIGSEPPPSISIILPTYNRWRLVTRAIQSVQAQTFTDWELLIIDDGSRDGTYDFVTTETNGDKRMRYHYATNRGLPMARNIGLTIGRGKYFTFLDDDDEYTPEHLAIRVEYLQTHPEVELLHGGVEVIGSEMVADKNDPTKLIPISECVVGGTFFIRRDLSERLGGFRPIKYGDDNDFFTRAEAAGAVIHKINAQTYRYHRSEADSLTAIAAKEAAEGFGFYRKR
ncbi:MAG: glycosyltransferase family 2 protein [Candidatus Kapaibacterium sp.]